MRTSTRLITPSSGRPVSLRHTQLGFRSASADDCLDHLADCSFIISNAGALLLRLALVAKVPDPTTRTTAGVLFTRLVVADFRSPRRQLGRRVARARQDRHAAALAQRRAARVGAAAAAFWPAEPCEQLVDHFRSAFPCLVNLIVNSSCAASEAPPVPPPAAGSLLSPHQSAPPLPPLPPQPRLPPGTPATAAPSDPDPLPLPHPLAPPTAPSATFAAAPVLAAGVSATSPATTSPDPFWWMQTEIRRLPGHYEGLPGAWENWGASGGGGEGWELGGDEGLQSALDGAEVEFDLLGFLQGTGAGMKSVSGV